MTHTIRTINATFLAIVVIFLSACVTGPQRSDASLSPEERFVNRCMEEQNSGRTKGSIIGGVTGAVAGTLADRRKLGIGTLLGGAAGAGAGYYVGRENDLKECRIRWVISKNDALSGQVEVMRDRERNLLRLVGSDKVTFDSGKADVKPAFQAFLHDVGRIVESDQQMHITVIGHTDSEGSESYNQALSERRAYAVAAILEQYTGNLEVYGRGELDPVADNSTPEGRARNRRVEIEIALPEDS